MNQLLKSPVREICTLGSVGAGGGRLLPATQWAARESRPYRDQNAALEPFVTKEFGKARHLNQIFSNV